MALTTVGEAICLAALRCRSLIFARLLFGVRRSYELLQQYANNSTLSLQNQ